jgi:eukaryotic-like serine/threonine-protein kinase
MMPDRWERVQALFEEALASGPDERTVLLEHRCAGDAELLLEVSSLLRAAEAAGPADDLAERVVAPVMEQFSEMPMPGTRIGPWRITRVLGEGGMGTVYEAEREDPELRQVVALKLVRDGLSAELRRRFVHERQIVARLEHPNIARLLDGGVTDRGRPYFAMELVDGIPIDRFCDQHGLPIRVRLQLFLRVCGAVAHAHRALIVHRDLKPANVLVTEGGEVKLLDFGIAKIMSGSIAEGIANTSTGLRLLTPSYASPEQIRGEPIGTATDVYSLGVILYELLTGRRPYRTTSTVRHEIEQAICTEEPERPSTAVRREVAGGRSDTVVSYSRDGDRRQLRRQLLGDLDVIALRALEKDPGQRYHSVDALADDISRHLAGQPVLARRHTVGYRARSFARRNRVWVLAAIVAGVSLLGGSVAALWHAAEARAQATHAAAERDRARLEAEKATAVSEFLTSLFSASTPEEARGAMLTAHELLERGASRVNTELQAQPEIRATMMGVIGKAYLALGDLPRAQPLLDSALSLRASGGAERAEYADALGDVAAAHAQAGQFAAAESLAVQVVALRRRLLPETDERVAASVENVGAIAHQRGELDRAEPLLREGLAMRLLHGANERTTAATMVSLAHLLKEKGVLEEADSLLAAAIRIQRRALGEHHPQLALSLNNRATLLYERTLYDSAEAPLRESLAIRRRVLGDVHPDVARTMNNLAALREKQGHLAEAEALYRESLELKRRSLPAGHPSIAINLNNLALLVQRDGRLREAEALFRESLAIRRSAIGSDHPLVATSAANLGNFLAEARRFPEALALQREALAIRERRLPPAHWTTANAATDLGATLALLGRHVEAEPLLVRGYEGLLSARGAKDNYTKKAKQRLDEHRARRVVRASGNR